MFSDLQGEFSPSVYETGRLVNRAPSLRGHAARIRFLLDHQRGDGGWGGPGEYGLVPTLSATEALLTVLRQKPAETNFDDVARATDRGLRALFERLNTGRPPKLPDTVAIEILVPGLIAEINAHLDRLDTEPMGGLGSWRTGVPLLAPPDANPELLARLRSLLERGQPLPPKLFHSLEVLGDAATGASFVEPVSGCVGCSPAATATWLGDDAVRAGRHNGARYLDAVQERGGGPVPVAAPLALFERAWVLSTLTGAGLPVAPHAGLLHDLHNAFGELGVSGGPGLPPDVDDTAAVLYALALLGSPRRPDSLWEYRSGQHFMCYPAERTPSTTANAHVLQAFGANLRRNLPQRDRYLDAIGELIDWLCDRQEPDGSWRDKWHASPYYATNCCAVALTDYGGAAAAPAVRRAVRWVLDTQRPNGSWGRWTGTFEETAYAVQILLRARIRPTPELLRAAADGVRFLERSDAYQDHPPLWHDKDLYAPGRIVRVEGLAAVYLARANPRVAALLDEPARTRTRMGSACQP